LVKTAAYTLSDSLCLQASEAKSALGLLSLSFIAGPSLLISSVFHLWMPWDTCLLNDDKGTEPGSVLCSADKPLLDPKILFLRTDVCTQNTLAFTVFVLFFFPPKIAFSVDYQCSWFLSFPFLAGVQELQLTLVF